MSVLIVILQILACTGLGAVAFRALGLDQSFNRQSHIVWAFAVGMGLLGWSLFFLAFADFVSPLSLAGVLMVSALGNMFLRRHPGAPTEDWHPSAALGAVGITLLALLGAVVFFDITEALAPPADADTLAYHFAIPKQILAAHGLIFIPRAVDGAAPFLTHMTYMSALGLGGERALTFWTLISGYLPAALLFVVARRYLDSHWCLMLVLAFLTTPAVIYGGGSGQVEVRAATYVLAGTMALVFAAQYPSKHLRWLVIAGMCAGFYAGSKHFGLFFMAAGGLVAIMHRDWFVRGAIFSAVALAAGFQWYAWNYVNTGDPVFPTLYGFLPYTNALLWDPAHHAMFENRVTNYELTLLQTPWWMVLYPFAATFSGISAFEGGRVGFGPFLYILSLPAFALCWQRRHTLIHHPLSVAVLTLLIFYVLWYMIGPSQRLRHLLPIYPMLLLLFGIAVVKWAQTRTKVITLIVMLAPAITLQLGISALFAESYIQRVITQPSRDAYLNSVISNYAPVPWINANLSATDRVLINERQLEYYLDVSVFFGDVDQALLNTLPSATNPAVYLAQLDRLGITHILAFGPSNPSSLPTQAKGYDLWQALLKRGCAKEIKRMPSENIPSRTLASETKKPQLAKIIQLTDDGCSL